MKSSVQRVAPIFLTLLLIASIAVIAVMNSFAITAKARDMQVANAEDLTRKMGTYFDNALTQARESSKQLSAHLPMLHGTPSDKTDHALLAQLAGVSGNAAVALVDDKGRLLNSAGPSKLLPTAASSDAQQSMFTSVSAIGFGLSKTLKGVGGDRIIAYAVHSQTPKINMVYYIPAAKWGMDLYLHDFAAGTAAHFSIADANGKIQWASDPNRLDTLIPGFTNQRATSSSLTRVSVAGAKTAVVSLRGSWGGMLVFDEPVSSLFGGIEQNTQRATVAMVALMLLLVVIFGALLYRRHRIVRMSDARHQALVANINDAVMVVDGTHVTYASPTVLGLLGHDPVEAIGAELAAIVGETAGEALAAATLATASRERPVTVSSLPCTTAEGKTVWVEATVADQSANASIRGTVISLHDVTEQRLNAELLWHEATHDHLTGLSNRSMFIEAVQGGLQRVRRNESLLAVLYLDLDCFKMVNDTLGHQVGDQVLKEVGERITSCVRASDTAARIGGDEFGVVLDPITNPAQAEDLCRRMMETINQPVRAGDQTIQIGVSIGIAVASATTESSDAMIRDADLAMYQAKESGKNQFRVALIPPASKTVLLPRPRPMGEPFIPRESPADQGAPPR